MTQSKLFVWYLLVKMRGITGICELKMINWQYVNNSDLN